MLFDDETDFDDVVLVDFLLLLVTLEVETGVDFSFLAGGISSTDSTKLRRFARSARLFAVDSLDISIAEDFDEFAYE